MFTFYLDFWLALAVSIITLVVVSLVVLTLENLWVAITLLTCYSYLLTKAVQKFLLSAFDGVSISARADTQIKLSKEVLKRLNNEDEAQIKSFLNGVIQDGQEVTRYLLGDVNEGDND